MTMSAKEEPDLNASPIVRYAKKLLPFTDEFREEKFSVIENGKRILS